MAEVKTALDTLITLSNDGGPAIIIGAPFIEADNLYNSAFVIDKGELLGRRDKVQLPNYGVFDDKRHFSKV